MRALKFRFYDSKVKQKMIYQNPIEAKDVIFHQWETTPKASPLMQWTGLKDVNGKEIYEGDIDSDEYNNLAVICYIEKYGAYCVVPLELYLHENYEDEVIYQYGYDCYFHNCTPEKYINIVGNIYENPELLKSSIK